MKVSPCVLLFGQNISTDITSLAQAVSMYNLPVGFDLASDAVLHLEQLFPDTNLHLLRLLLPAMDTSWRMLDMEVILSYSSLTFLKLMSFHPYIASTSKQSLYTLPISYRTLKNIVHASLKPTESYWPTTRFREA